MILLVGCDVSKTSPGTADTRLNFSGVADTVGTKTIPIQPKGVSERTASTVFRADVQTDNGLVQLRKVAISITATASLSDMLVGAQLKLAGATYPLDRIHSEPAPSGLLIFTIPKPVDAPVISAEPQPLQLSVRYKHAAAGEQLQARINREARQQTTAYQANANRELASDQKAGLVIGPQYQLRKIGAHLKVESMSAESANQDIRFRMRMTISAFETSVRLPWRAYRSARQPGDYPQAGFHYELADTSGQLVREGQVKATTLQSTTDDVALHPPTDQLHVRHGKKRNVTIFVRYNPDQHSTGRLCFQLAALRYYSAERERLLALPNAGRQCHNHSK